MTSRLLLLPAFVIALVPGLALAQMASSASSSLSPPPGLSKGTPGLVLPAPTPMGSSSAGPALVINGTQPAGTSSMALPVLPPVQDDSLGSSQLRESTHIKAMIDLEKLKASLEDAQHSRQLAQKKFTEDLATTPDSKKGGTPGSATAMVAPIIQPTVKPYATSYYDFNGKSFARLVFNGAQFVVNQGSQLPDGAQVDSISPAHVIVSQHGRKITVPYLGGGLGSGE